MALLYSPPSPHGHFYYEASQLAAFALYIGLLLAQGWRRGYAWRSWLPLVAAATLALVLGCQLVFLPLGDWPGWLRGDADLVRAVAEGPRSIVGGAAASLVVVLALRRVLGFRGWAVLDAFAGPLCWALAAQSVGCLLVGCCWGEAAAGGWGFSYGPGTVPYATQVAQGLLPAGAAHTLPLVPTQLYHLLLCASTGLVLHRLRHRAASWPAGSRYLLAMGLLCLGRLVVEFWRDPAGEPLLAAPLTLAGCSLPGLQWLLLAEAAGLLGGWAWLVRRAGPAVAAERRPTPLAGVPALVGLALLAATAQLGPAALTVPEIVVIQALLLAVLLAEAYAWLPGLGRGVPRLAGMPLSLLLGGALLLATAQAPAPQQNPPATSTAGPQRSITFSVGTLHNQYDEHPTGSCSSSAYTYGHRTKATGGEVAYQWAPNTETHLVSAVGGGVWVGNEAVDLLDVTGTPYYAPAPDYLGDHTLYDVHVYAEGHQTWAAGSDLGIDYRGGLHLGQLGYSIIGNSDAVRSLGVLPEFMVAIGNRRTIFSQLDLGYGPENALGSYAVRAATY